jgi:hypothetical protein
MLIMLNEKIVKKKKGENIYPKYCLKQCQKSVCIFFFVWMINS